jgi:hypothetical protein
MGNKDAAFIRMDDYPEFYQASDFLPLSFLENFAVVQGFPNQGIAFPVAAFSVIRAPGQQIDGKPGIGPVQDFQ